ncbi:hypothetical protein OK142_01090 [Agrobacterium sp. BT-220-3]|jgi:hypothetical protein|nr:hypothetical protein [Agrobacterium sp. BT-220-3]
MRLVDLTGQRFGRLVVTGRSASVNKRTRWVVVCDCGTEKVVGAQNLTNPNPKSRIVSCGCYGAEARRASLITHGESKSPEMKMFWEAKKRSKLRGQTFTISREDISIPDVCPLLGIPLFLTPGKQTPNSPSLDRVDSSRGYEPGNVQVISNRANAMKHDATFEEFEMMYLNWKKQRAAS